MSNTIQAYWESRASTYSSKPAACTDDIHLRRLEITTITRIIRGFQVQNGTVLDAGCGDGYSTVAVAEAFSDRSFLGVDYSPGMIDLANQRVRERPDLGSRLTFRVGNILNLSDACGTALYDVVVTDRVLINLDSIESQCLAFSEIARHTKSGGWYIAIENFIEGHDHMNKMRQAVGLPAIEVRWHNRYFREKEFLDGCRPFFDIVTLEDFSSSYYLATRVVYSAMCRMRGETPDYNHEIHQLSVQLPAFGQFSPIRLAVLRKKR